MCMGSSAIPETTSPFHLTRGLLLDRDFLKRLREIRRALTALKAAYQRKLTVAAIFPQ